MKYKNNNWERLVSSWYSYPSQPLYLSVFCSGAGQLHHFQFEIIIKPDQPTSAVSVNPMNNSQISGKSHTGVGQYSICGTIYTGQTSPNMDSRPILANIVLPGSKSSIPSLCPATGRAVYLDGNNNDGLTVLDFL